MQKVFSLLFYSSFQVLGSKSKISSETPLLQAEQSQPSQPVFIGEVFQHFYVPPLDLLQQQVHVFPSLRTPDLDAALQAGSHQISF